MPEATTQDARAETSAARVLREDEIIRHRRYTLGEIVLVSGALIGLSRAQGDPTLRRWVAVAAVATLVALVVTAFALRRADDYPPQRIMRLKAPLLALIPLGLAYLGVFSPAAALLPFGIYHYGTGRSALVAWATYVYTAVVTAGLMVLITTGVLPDTGLIRAESLTTGDRLAFAVLVQLALGFTFVVARLSRETLLSSIDQLERMARRVGQREAELGEAHVDLEQALRGRGRMTGSAVGRWQLGALLGRGGMGEVYAAVDGQSGEAAAVKVLVVDREGDTTALERFRREAAALARVEHPGVVHVREIGSSEQGPFIAMERLDGYDLAVRLRQTERLERDELLLLVEQVADALESAHRADVVHRDLKPQNLFWVASAARWKILDFGISKLGGSGTLTLGRPIGTPGYMAPEQAFGADVDHRADLFALAVIVYRCATGRRPFQGDLGQFVFEVVSRQPSRPGQFADLPEDVDLVIALGLAKRPEDRPRSASVFAALLRSAFEGRLDEAERARARALVDAEPWGDLLRDPRAVERSAAPTT